MIKPCPEKIISFIESSVVHCTDVFLRISSSVVSVALSKIVMEVAYGYHWLNNKNRQNSLPHSNKDRCQLDVNASHLSKNMHRLDGDMSRIDDGMDNLKLDLDAFEDMLGCFRSGVGDLREELGDLCLELQEFLEKVDCETLRCVLEADCDDFSSDGLTSERSLSDESILARSISDTDFEYEVQEFGYF